VNRAATCAGGKAERPRSALTKNTAPTEKMLFSTSEASTLLKIKDRDSYNAENELQKSPQMPPKRASSARKSSNEAKTNPNGEQGSKPRLLGSLQNPRRGRSQSRRQCRYLSGFDATLSGRAAVGQFAAAALSERRNSLRFNTGGHRPPLQHQTDPLPGERWCPNFRCSAGFQPALSRQDGGATFKLGHCPESKFLDTPEKHMLNFLSLTMRQIASRGGVL
jgi:hypothetical protein